MLEPIRPHILTAALYMICFAAYQCVLEIILSLIKAIISKRMGRLYRLNILIGSILLAAMAALAAVDVVMAHGRFVAVPHRRAVIIILVLIGAARPAHKLLVWILFDIDEEEYYEKRG